MTTLTERAATGVLRVLTGRLWGFHPNLMPEIVQRLGAGGALAWFAKNMPRYEKTMKLLGPRRTHLLCLETSLLNGCGYCVFGHAYAFQLYYFKEREALFPLDEHQIVGLRRLPDVEVRAALESAFAQAGMPEETAALAKLWALRLDGAVADDDEGRRMLHLIEMFNVLNYCGVDSASSADEAHDPINKDEELRARYAEARLTASP